MTLKKPKAIIFDLDDTIYSYRKAHELALNKVQLKLKNEFGIDQLVFKKYYEIDRKMRNAECNNFFLLSMPRILIENIGFISITIFILITLIRFGVEGVGVGEI